MDQSHEHAHAHAAHDGLVQAAARLRAAGERVTNQRLAMLEVLATHVDYLTADELVALVQQKHPNIHRATVYRTLDRFVELGLVSRLPGNGGATVFHLAALAHSHEHLHGQCRSCRAVVNLPSDAFDGVIAALTSNFIFEPDQSALFGLCAHCASKS